MKLQKSVISLIVLIIWAVFSVVFIGWDMWSDFKVNQAQLAFNNGAEQGYQKAFVDIATATQKCEAVPLNVGQDKDGKAITVEIIATACLEKPADEKAPAAKK